MRVEVYGHVWAHCLSDGLHQGLHLSGSHQARHVLNAQDVRARPLDAACQLRVVRGGVDGGLQAVASVAHAHLCHLAALQHCLYAHQHVVELVPAVEYAEHVHAVDSSQSHELLHHVVSVGGVAHCVGAAYKHLQHHVGARLPECPESLPRVLVQETHSHVEGGAPPRLQRKRPLQHLGSNLCALHQVDRAHPSGQQALVRVSHGGVRHQHAGLCRHPLLAEEGCSLGLQHGLGGHPPHRVATGYHCNGAWGGGGAEALLQCGRRDGLADVGRRQLAVPAAVPQHDLSRQVLQ
mmetsp:Transcript_27270/g.60372  ORF Transcript_27270/g.60372 Transcript_27270/m.60372 type:complete len:293 (+) Transcript_27270:1558-2436(+)